MKRIISVLLILMMMVPPMVFPAKAAATADAVVRLTADKETVTVGDEVTVTVEYENISACGSVDFSLVYDPTYLQAPADADVVMNITGYSVKNPVGVVEERNSKELQGRRAVKVVSAAAGNCLKATSGTLFTVKFVVAKEAPAPGIPLIFHGIFNNLYSEKDMANTIQVVNTHLTCANPEKTVKSVTLAQAPTKTQYVQGQALNLEGGRLAVTYEGETEPQEVLLSLAQITQYDSAKLGPQTVKATYAGKEISFDINTDAAEFSSISIGKVPSKIEYVQGTGTMDKSGGVLLLHYTGSLIKTLDMTDSSVTLSGYQPNTLGFQQIQVHYGGFQAEYTITVVKKALSKIDIRTPMICDTCKLEQSAFDLITAAGGDPSAMTFDERQKYIADATKNVTCLSDTCAGTTFSTKMKMLYFIGENFDVENATLFVTYTDKTTEEMDLTLEMVTFDSSTQSIQTVEIVYGSKSTLIKDVQTKRREVTEVKVVQEPDKKIYVQGQSFDATGGIINVKYDDGTDENIPMTASGVLFSYNELNSLGFQRIYVSYRSKKDYFNVEVIARAVESFTVDAEAKSTYVQGQQLDPNTVLDLLYNDKSTDVAYLKDATVEGYNPDQVGLQLVKITYAGKTFDWPVTVVKKVVTDLKLVGTPPTTVLEEMALDLGNCTLTASYNDGAKEEAIAITPAMIQFNAQIGTQTVTVSYKEGNVTFEIEVLQKSLIAIETEGMKDQYLLNEELDRSVGRIKLIYDNETFDYIDFSDEAIAAEGFSSDAEGQYTVTVRYQGKETTYTVNVHREIREIAVTAPNKTEYKEGEPLDLTGGVVHITYYNSLTDDQPLTLGMISGYDPDQTGEQILTVEIGGVQTTFTVNVIPKVLLEITVEPLAIDHNEWEELDLSQVVVTAWYDNDTSQVLPLAEVEQIVNETYVTYKYEGKSTTLFINLTRTAPILIEWAEQPQKITYVQGDPLLKDGKIYVRYNDPYTNELLPLTDENIAVSGDTNTLGTKTVYVQYKNLSPISFEIYVLPKLPTKIEVIEKPNCSYIEGQPLNLEGGKILITYNNGDTEPKAMDAVGVTLSGYDPAKIGEQTVTVTYSGKTADFTVNVRAKKADSIRVSTLPKTDYLEGKDTALNLAGGKLTVTYDNGASAVVDLSAATVSGFDKTRFGTQTISVEYLGLKTEFKVTMAKKAVESIAIAALPTKMQYRQGVEKFNAAGGKLLVRYNNGTKETINLSADMVSGFSNLFAGTVTLTATYGGKSAQFEVLILPENPFVDVKAGAYFEEPVLWAVAQGITNGMDATHFAPDAKCTRGQIVTFLWRTAGSPEPQSTRNPFKDVKSNQYYYKAVLWAVEQGITNGMSANTFAPEATCTRGQVVTFLWRAKGKPAANTSNSFTDVKKGAYYYDAVLWAVKNGITNGMGNNKFAPETTCTRGQIVTFLYRAYN